MPNLRLSPSGPDVGDVSGGFQLRRAAVANDANGSISVANNGNVRGGPVPLAGLSDENSVRVELEAHAQIQQTWTATGTVTWVFEYTADNGANWTSFYSRAISVGGLVARDFQSPDNLSISSTPVESSALTGVTSGDDVQFRARAELTSGVDDGIIFPSSPVAVVLAVVEELSA